MRTMIHLHVWIQKFPKRCNILKPLAVSPISDEKINSRPVIVVVPAGMVTVLIIALRLTALRSVSPDHSTVITLPEQGASIPPFDALTTSIQSGPIMLSVVQIHQRTSGNASVQSPSAIDPVVYA